MIRPVIALLTSAALAPANLLITEINSNGTGGDFFELHNSGAAPIDLTGWKWVDNASVANGGPSYNGIRAFEFDPFLLQPGAVAIVVTDAGGGTAGNDIFASSWGGLAAVTFLTFDVPPPGTGNGLGQNDLIAIFNAAGNFVSGVNYGTTAVNVTAASGVIALPPVPRTGGSPSAGGHAGAAVGGTATESLVWNPSSGSTTPTYINASSVGGAFSHPNSTATIGSPGVLGSGPAGNFPPSFTSPGTIFGVAGFDLSNSLFFITATDPNPGQTVTLSIVSKPSWLNVNLVTGAVSGIPPAAGDFPLVVKATDNGSPVASSEQAITVTIFPESATVLLNEFNAVTATNFLGGGTVDSPTNSDPFYGRILGNGGEWFELVVVGDGTAGSTVDLRGWKIEVLGDLGPRTVVLSQDPYWSNVVAGTLLTFTVNNSANGGADTQIHQSSALHSSGHLWSNIWIFDPAFVDQAASIFENRLGISNNDTRFVIRNATGTAIFGPAGEGIATGGNPPGIVGLGSTEVMKLEADPAPFIDPYYSPFSDGTTSSFGAPNQWSGGQNTQSFDAYVRQNSPPRILSTPVTQAYGGYTYVITTSDPNGHPVGLTAPGLPSFLTLTPGAPGTATLSTNRPLTAADAGFHTIRIVASDGQATNSQTPQVFTLTVFHNQPSLIVNEYNAVAPANFIGGPESTATDTHFGRVGGNGGRWVELVVVGNGSSGTVDLRGWQIEIGTTRQGGSFAPVNILTLSQAPAWSAVRAGTILTFIHANTAAGGMDTSIQHRNRATTIGDSWTNIWMGDTQYVTVTGASLEGDVVTGIRIDQNNAQFVIKNAAGHSIFGPAGEGIAPASGISSIAVFELEGHPTPGVAPFITSDNSVVPPREGYDNGLSGSTFGWPNEWQSGIDGPTTLQNFTPYIDAVTESPFQLWINGFPAVTDKAPGADPDKDGRSNYAEYAFGGNPGLADAPAAPQTLAHDTSAATWTFAIRDDNAIAYTLKRSADLGTWHLLPDGSMTEAIPHPTLAGFLLVTATTPPSPINGREFFRIELTLPSP